MINGPLFGPLFQLNPNLAQQTNKPPKKQTAPTVSIYGLRYAAPASRASGPGGFVQATDQGTYLCMYAQRSIDSGLSTTAGVGTNSHY